MINYKEYISVDSSIRFGRPCIKGTRISVYDVLGWLANGQTAEQIISEYPQLTKEQIQACLYYASDKERMIRVT
ncbi:MAG TPA: DUF433 domain-containing protein [Bacteroidia bacterium]|nr:DUF433 domain-containing protein [Bacteroidia bacterium]